MFDSCVPYEVLRKLPYECRIPVNDFDELELILEGHDEKGFYNLWEMNK
jgi:hypothetical protein